MPFTNKKIIVAGNNIHLYEYTRPIQYGISIFQRKKKKRNTLRTFEQNKKSAYRAVKSFRLLLSANGEKAFATIQGNERVVFVTLTFAEDITDITTANKLFTFFIKRFNYSKKINLKYIAVPEVQQKRKEKSGLSVWHYHVIFFNFPKVDNTNYLLSQYWKFGFNFNNTVKSFIHLQRYLSKYFLKTFEYPNFVNKKRYFRSRNLLSPRVYRDQEQNDTITSFISGEPEFHNVYLDRFGGEVTYTLFKDQNIAELL